MDITTSSEARNMFSDLGNQIEDLENLQAIEDELVINKIEQSLKTEEFETWEEAKKDIMNHFGFT